MSSSLQFFVEQRLDEDKLINHLNLYLSRGVESIDFPLSDADFFLQVQDYSDGFCMGLNISWRDDQELDIDGFELAKSIAREFTSNILVENIDEENGWWLIDSAGNRFVVRVEELEDGITMDSKFDKVKFN
ncbi:MAG: hypothetical protein JAZ11_09235 [Candidatus Thiodiazotropha lotti]|nr:hypothetical protein [Candidatus Thiodiazotropha lotti]ODC01618.1 hypothetical protein A3197_03875 [Candidatus Thiodiazotropha endoloripes]